MMDQSAKTFPAFCPKNLHFFSDRLSEETYGKASYYLEIDGFWGNFWSKMAKVTNFLIKSQKSRQFSKIKSAGGLQIKWLSQN